MNLLDELVPCLPLGNRKVGRVLTFSLPSGITCPGSSPWCRANCYALRLERLRPHCRQAYLRNLVLSLDWNTFTERILESLPSDARFIRLHVGGDFHGPAYIEAWQTICDARPKVRFWCYTRSWRLPHLRPALESLRRKRNIQLFASVDPTIPECPPPDWRIAYLHSDERKNGLPCPHQQHKADSCLECGYCFLKEQGNVVFTEH